MRQHATLTANPSMSSSRPASPNSPSHRDALQTQIQTDDERHEAQAAARKVEFDASLERLVLKVQRTQTEGRAEFRWEISDTLCRQTRTVLTASVTSLANLGIAFAVLAGVPSSAI